MGKITRCLLQNQGLSTLIFYIGDDIMSKEFQNEKMMNIVLDEITYAKWCKGLKELHLNRIKKGLKTSTFIIPLVYELNEKEYRLDAWMPGRKAVKKNDKGQDVYAKMYRYIVPKIIMEEFFKKESLGQAYNFLVKQNEYVAKGELVVDIKDPNMAPTRFDLAKKYRQELKA